MFWIGFIVGIFLGAFLGFFLLAILTANRDTYIEDKVRYELAQKKEKDELDDKNEF